MTHTRVVGWGPFRLPGEKKRSERAAREAHELMMLARGPRQTWEINGRTAERCPWCGAPKWVDEACPDVESHA